MPRSRIRPGEHGVIAYIRGESGWTARTRLRDSRTGRIVTVTVQRPTRSRAERALRDKIRTGTVSTGPVSAVATPQAALTPATPVDQACGIWLAHYRPRQTKPQTTGQYDRAIRRHIAPALGAFRLGDLTPGALAGFILGLQPAPGKFCRTILRGTLKVAYRQQATRLDLSGSMPPAPHGSSTPSPTAHRGLTVPEVKSLLAALDAYQVTRHPHGMTGATRWAVPDIARVMLATGMRIGEILALRVRDLRAPRYPEDPWTVTVAGTIVAVEDTAGHTATRRQEGTKTAHGMRTLPLTDAAAAILREYVGLAGTDPDALIFATRTGGIVQPGDVRRAWREAVRIYAPDLRGVTPHALRRTAATAIVRALDPTSAARFLGHGPSTATLFAHYVDWGEVPIPAQSAQVLSDLG